MKNMPVDLQVFDMMSHGYPEHFPKSSFQIRPTASWFTLFSVFVTLKNIPMPQSQATAMVPWLFNILRFHVQAYAYLDAASRQMNL
jgi:hypothetical protein